MTKREKTEQEKLKDEYERLVIERMEAQQIEFTPEDFDGKTH